MTSSNTGTTMADAWTAVADAWDREVDGLDAVTGHAAATQVLIDRLAVRPGDRVLELAAGPGSLGPAWSRHVGPQGAVVLSDVSPAMVDIARRRNTGVARTEVEVLDLSAIDRPDASFDAVAARMGLMFAPDARVAVAEAHRVLTPGGRFGAMTWAGMEHNPWLTCVGMAAMTQGLTPGGPPIGPGGIFSLGDPDALAALLGSAGFEDVVVDAFEVTFHAADIDAHIDRVTSLAGPLATYLAAATPEQLEAVRATAADLARPYLTDDGLAMPGRALVATGRRRRS